VTATGRRARIIVFNDECRRGSASADRHEHVYGEREIEELPAAARRLEPSLACAA
jgi:hypothetical protein